MQAPRNTRPVESRKRHIEGACSDKVISKGARILHGRASINQMLDQNSLLGGDVSML